VGPPAKRQAIKPAEPPQSKYVNKVVNLDKNPFYLTPNFKNKCRI